jgi:hypothetical protein
MRTRSSEKRARLAPSSVTEEFSTPESTFDLRWKLAESAGDWSSRGSGSYDIIFSLVWIRDHLLGPNAENLFPYWEDGDFASIPEGYLEKGITWPLSGYVPPTPENILGLEKRWPHPPWPKDGGQSMSLFGYYALLQPYRRGGKFKAGCGQSG